MLPLRNYRFGEGSRSMERAVHCLAKFLVSRSNHWRSLKLEDLLRRQRSLDQTKAMHSKIRWGDSVTWPEAELPLLPWKTGHNQRRSLPKASVQRDAGGLLAGHFSIFEDERFDSCETPITIRCIDSIFESMYLRRCPYAQSQAPPRTRGPTPLLHGPSNKKAH